MQLGPDARRIRQAAEQRVDGIEHHALRTDAIDGLPQPDEQAFEVEATAFKHLLRVQHDTIHNHLSAGDHRLHIEPQGVHVLRDIERAFLEGHQHPGLVELGNTTVQKFHGQYRFAGTRAAAHECRATRGQTAPGDRVEPLDAG